MKRRQTKSAIWKRYAKKHRMKIKDLKVIRLTPKDIQGLPVLDHWGKPYMKVPVYANGSGLLKIQRVGGASVPTPDDVLIGEIQLYHPSKDPLVKEKPVDLVAKITELADIVCEAVTNLKLTENVMYDRGVYEGMQKVQQIIYDYRTYCLKFSK